MLINEITSRRTCRINNLTIGFFILTYLFVSCKHKDHSLNEEKYKLNLKIKATTKCYYNINNETDTYYETIEKEIENENNSEIGILSEIEPSDSTGNVSIKITFDKFRIKTKNQDNETQIDAGNTANSFDPVERFIGNIKGSSIIVTANKKGEVSSDKGIKVFTDSLLSKMAFTDENSKQQLKEQVSKLMEESLIKNNITQTFNLFPDTAIYEGDTWTKKEVTKSADFVLNAVTKYTLLSVDHGLAKIETKSEVSSTGNIEVNAIGSNPSANLKGTQKGKLEIDIKTGLLLNSLSLTNISGEMQVMGRTVPIKIKIERKVKGKRL